MLQIVKTILSGSGPGDGLVGVFALAALMLGAILALLLRKNENSMLSFFALLSDPAGPDDRQPTEAANEEEVADEALK